MAILIKLTKVTQLLVLVGDHKETGSMESLKMSGPFGLKSKGLHRLELFPLVLWCKAGKTVASLLYARYVANGFFGKKNKHYGFP